MRNTHATDLYSVGDNDLDWVVMERKTSIDVEIRKVVTELGGKFAWLS